MASKKKNQIEITNELSSIIRKSGQSVNSQGNLNQRYLSNSKRGQGQNHVKITMAPQRPQSSSKRGKFRENKVIKTKVKTNQTDKKVNNVVEQVQQQFMSLQHIPFQTNFVQEKLQTLAGHHTTTNASFQEKMQMQGTKSAFPISTMSTLQPEELLQQIRQNSVQSHESQGSRKHQDPQYRRRLVALAQAQQQKLAMMKIPIKQSNSLENSQDSSGVKVISKKLISFQGQSQADEYCTVDNQGQKKSRLISGNPQRFIQDQAFNTVGSWRGPPTLQTMPMDLSALNSDFQNTQREILGATQTLTKQGSVLQQSNVIFHPHPLNKNVETIDSSRINRNSRQNLKPIIPNEIASSRDRNFVVVPQQFNSASNPQISVKNQNVQFKFKKNSQTNRVAPNAKPIMIRKNNFVSNEPVIGIRNSMQQQTQKKQSMSQPKQQDSQIQDKKYEQQPVFKPSQTENFFTNQTGLGEIVSDFGKVQVPKKTNSSGVVNTARGEIMKTDGSHQKLILDGAKLIKLNKSKKMLDTARRSRIQQLDNYNTTVTQGLSLVQLNSNGPPAGAMVSSATNKSAKSKQILGIQYEQTYSQINKNKYSTIIQSQNQNQKLEEEPKKNNFVKEPLRRGQIFKKQMESSDNLQKIKSIKKIIQTKDMETEDSKDPIPPQECVKIENQLSPVKQRIEDVAPPQQQITRTTATDSVRKNESQQRVNFNTSIQPNNRGVVNTTFSLGSSIDEIPPLPTTPQNILKYYINDLTEYEKGEILDYETVYFLGKSKEKKIAGKVMSQNKDSDSEKSKEVEKDGEYNHNHGFDDDKGDYKIINGDHIGYRYEIVEFLGKGSFGTALKVIDHKEKRELAIKIVKNKKKYYYQASVELKILQYLRQHDTDDIMNVIHIEDYVVFRKHLCMAFELLSMNLFEFLKINDFNGFDHNLIRRFAIQLLYALKYLKQLEIIHCDLKPENILLKEENKSGIKIIDFGSSTFIDEKVYTYIQSRFYRAPEIMLGIPYSPAIDMWSLGCIMAELYIGYPLFPGESENDQMSRIMEMRDCPPGDVLQLSERKMKFFTVAKETRTLEPIMLKNSRGKMRKPNGKPLDYVIGDEDPDFNDFVAKCLDWNPNTRLTPDDALKHVWVLKGLPPQVLIHHQKMHNIATPELPKDVKLARDEFIQEQKKEESRSKAKRDISQNPNAGRPAIQLKTPRSTIKERPQSGYPGTTKNASEKKEPIQQTPQQSAQGNTRRKFVIKKIQN